MSKLIPVAWQELVRRLRKLGFEGLYQGGKHPYMVREDLVLTIPTHIARKLALTFWCEFSGKQR